MSVVSYRTASVVAFALVLAGCASAPRTTAPVAPDEPPAPAPRAASGSVQSAVANLASASGTLVSGRLMLQAVDGGVRVRGDVGGLVRNGTHNLRLHARGDCSAVDATSAGPEFDPVRGALSREPDPGERGRIVADARGVARVELILPGAVLGGGAANDIAGRALLVLGATPGAIGARVACGVIAPDLPAASAPRTTP